MNRPVTRRHFLAWSAAAAAAVPAVAWTRTDDPIRLGIVGMGQRGSKLAQELHHRNCRVCAVSDVSVTQRDRARAITGADVYPDWQDLLRHEDLDAIVIATPDFLHAPMSIAAIEADKDVYCEAPMTRTVEEAIAVERVVAKSGRVVQIGATGVTAGSWITARDIVRQGLLGDVYWCQSSCGVPETLDRPSWRDSWDTSGGIASDKVFDRLASMMSSFGLGVPDRVSVAGGRYTGDNGAIPNSFVMTAEYDGGPKLVLTSANAHAGGAPTVIRGREASLYLFDATVIAEAEPGHERSFERRFGTTRRAVLDVARGDDLLDNWIASMRSRQPAVCGPEIAYPVMVTAAMGNEAYRGKRCVGYDAVAGRIVASPARRISSSVA